MVRTKVFKSNRTQAVRLPKDVALPEDVREVDVVKVGQSRVITPAGTGWDYWYEHGRTVSDDFMIEREQPPMQVREEL